MKWLIYLLLLLNISLFAWHFRGGMDGIDPAADTASDVQRLVLLREQQAQQDGELPWCYSLGPLKEREQARQLNRRLQQWEVASWQRKSQEAGRKGYWVLLAPLPSRVEARQVVAELRGKNIEDYFLIATGENANGISLGVFSTFEAAHRRINQLARLGFEAKWEEVRLPIDEYWLDWLRDAGGLSAPQLADLRKDFPGLKQIERRCQPPVEARHSRP